MIKLLTLDHPLDRNTFEIEFFNLSFNQKSKVISSSCTNDINRASSGKAACYILACTLNITIPGLIQYISMAVIDIGYSLTSTNHIAVGYRSEIPVTAPH